MEKWFKKTVAVVLTAAMAMSVGMPAFADEAKPEAAIIQQVADDFEVLNNYFSENNISVIEELEKAIAEEQAFLKTLPDEDTATKTKVEDLIGAYTNLLKDWENYQSSLNSGISTYGKPHEVFSAAVAAVVTYFRSNNYDLSAELLAYAADVSTGGTYSPVHIQHVYQTTLYKNTLEPSGNVSFKKHIEFNPGSSTADMDLYYALHGCDYIKDNDGIAIMDLYNYAGGDYGWTLAGIAVDIMIAAEQYGTLVPYNVWMYIP